MILFANNMKANELLGLLEVLCDDSVWFYSGDAADVDAVYVCHL